MSKIVFFLFLDVLAFSGVLVSTLPFLVSDLGGNILMITIIFASFSFFQFFSSPIWGSLSDRFGRKPLIILNCVAEIIANFILAISTNLTTVFISRLIAGIFKSNVSVGTAYIADITTEKNRAKGMGMFGMAFGLGFTIGPMLGGLIAGSNYTFESLSNVAWIAFLINIINLIFVIFFLKEPKKIQGRIHSKIFDKFSNQLTFLFERKLSIFFLIIFIIYFGFTGMEGIFAIWINETFNWGPQEVGLIMLYAGICQIVVQGFILRYLLNFFNEVQLIKSGFIFLITGFLLISTNQFYILLIAVAFLCYGIGVSNPCLNSIVSKNCNKNKKGLALGAAYSAQSIARFTGQPFAGLLFLYFGKDMPFITNAFILVGFSLIYFLFLKKTLNKTFR